MCPLEKTIVALDNMDEQALRNFLSKGKELPYIKIGLEMFCAKGPDFVKSLYQDYQKEIFLDLKLHDIPNTVRKSIRSLKGLPIKFLTIHLSGGQEMIKVAVEEAAQALPDTDLLGVSYLTSLSATDLEQIWGIQDTQEAFARMFQLALESKIQGLVLSAHELEMIKAMERKFGRNLIKVCPGIRFQDEIERSKAQGQAEHNDQKRVEDPHSALAKGANYLVIGRSLTQAQDLPSRINELQKTSLLA